MICEGRVNPAAMRLDIIQIEHTFKTVLLLVAFTKMLKDWKGFVESQNNLEHDFTR